MDHGIALETSAPATPEQNGHSERSEGVLLTKARAMRIGANLPGRLWPETIRAAAYIHNRTPLKKLGWITPFEKVTGNKPNLSHLKAYGCKAYSLRKDLPRTYKLAERAFIGYLVGYDSTNIFRIWIPSQDKVIRTRDVTFNETSFYDPTETDIGKILGKENRNPPPTTKEQTTLKQPFNLKLRKTRLPVNCQHLQNQWNPKYKLSYHKKLWSNKNKHKNKLSNDLDLCYQLNIAADITEETIIPEKSSRSSRNQNPNYSNDPFKKPRKPQKEAYAATLAQTQEYPKSTFYNAFSAAIHTPRPTTTLHRDNLPPEPKNFEELLNHPFGDRFMNALLEEIKKLEQIQTWKQVLATQEHAAKKQILPLTWVFKYKFDEEGYLIKFKARLCVRGDLQSTAQDTYAATLAARIFRGLMAIMAAFDLE
ncbi:Integrase catalytic core [Macrophomina phaseolina MS6]|uniref:Integrase catalytic core n=1 Tax=Macrophomina phaseolina (strain MS6) TaxID=1126212 RepID=K2R8Q9_MACPH|nr:Integrase catalytic core [Macrophomina phaseolina MS6]